MSDEIRRRLEALRDGPVPPTIAMDDEFRDIYTQGYRHALGDALAALPAEPPPEPFTPDWDMLAATRESLREHMALVADYKAAFKESTENLAAECEKSDALVALVRAWQAAERLVRDPDHGLPAREVFGREASASSALLAYPLAEDTETP